MSKPKVAVRPIAKPAAPQPADMEIKLMISKVSPVYVDSWQGEQDNCSICKIGFHQPCANCEVIGEVDPCPIQEGNCGHKFHMHCISKWIKEHSTCPLCSSHWEVKI